MIYEMVQQGLESLASLWADLEEAFTELGAEPSLTPVQRQLLVGSGTTNPNLARVARDEAALVRTKAIGLLSKPAQQLFADADSVFRASEAVRFTAVSRFEVASAFGTASGSDSAGVVRCRNLVQNLGGFISDAVGDFATIISPVGPAVSLSQISGSVDHLASFPVLTSEVAIAPASRGGSDGAATGFSFQRAIDDAFRKTLGRVPRTDDSRSFVAALTQSFAVAEVEGRTVVAWHPRALVGQTELGGGVTGRQASLYARARGALDASMPILETLYPLLPDPDDQEVSAAKAIVRTEFVSLVEELKIEGGPRVQRVDELLSLLLDQVIIGINGEPFTGALGYLEGVLGLTSGQVNTLEEESNLSQFFLLRDYIVETRASWVSFKADYQGKDFGTRLVLLARALSVVAESVEEVHAAMDSVFVGEAERGLARFADGNGGTMVISELLSWISTFAQSEASELVRDGGRRGVGAVFTTADRLETLVESLLAAIPVSTSLPESLRHPRVRNPLRELRTYLQEVQNLAKQVSTP